MVLIGVITLGVTALSAGCSRQVDRFVNRRVLDHATDSPDVDQTCSTGAALRHALSSLGKEKKPPHQALIVAETTAGLCEQAEAWEADLGKIRAKRMLQTIGPALAPDAQDARLRAAREHTQAAARFHRAWLHFEAKFAVDDDSCPKVKDHDTLTYLLGLFAGVSALLHDSAGGGEVGVPFDILGRVSRHAECVDNAKWWNVPGALTAAGWAMVPGSGPEAVDPWQRLEEEAASSEATGVRLARALQVLIASNAGRTEDVERGIQAHAAALSQPADPDWALFDAYAMQVSRHASDVLWTEAKGHRTRTFGELPGSQEPSPLPPDPFAEDPFGDSPAPDPSPPKEESP